MQSKGSVTLILTSYLHIVTKQLTSADWYKLNMKDYHIELSEFSIYSSQYCL